MVPCAAAGSLMFTPEISLAALRAMKDRFGDKIYGRYGFADAFHPTNGRVAEDVIALDTGITLLAAENLRSGNVWKWFMANPEAKRALDLAEINSTIGLRPVDAPKAQEFRMHPMTRRSMLALSVSAIPALRAAVSADDDKFLEDLSRRSFQYFWEYSDPDTGLTRDRPMPMALLTQRTGATSLASPPPDSAWPECASPPSASG